MNFKSSGSQGFYQEITAGSSSRGGVAGPYSTYQQSYGGGERDLNNGAGDEDSDDHQMLYRRGGGGEGSSSSTAAAAAVEREHMFDKVVTPSDVGKLNRLVIPKQHAEKYFPLDSSANEKGLLLNFEDRNGKPWRFRYSYWNSSQSYVMTKGWSRFVKEKKLDAGDIVSFQRGVGDHAKDRLFIDWRRRPDAPVDLLPPPSSHHHHLMMRSSVPHPPWTTTTPLFNYSHFLQPPTGYGPYTYGNPCPPGSLVYLRSAAAAGGGGVFSPQHGGASAAVAGQRVQGDQMVFDSVPVVQGKAAAKRLRLFGVNMDCPISETDECENHILSSTTLPFHHHLPPRPPPPPPQNFDSFSSSSSSVPSLQFLRHHQNEHHEDKLGKGSMSLDLDI